MLGMTDLKPLVKKAFERSFIDNRVLGFEHFEEDLKTGDRASWRTTASG